MLIDILMGLSFFFDVYRSVAFYHASSKITLLTSLRPFLDI